MHIKNGLRFRFRVSGKTILLAFFCWIAAWPVQAQCAMCRAALEGDANSGKAEAVNDGIVYLMIIPYLLVGIIGYYIYKTGKKLNARKD